MLTRRHSDLASDPGIERALGCWLRWLAVVVLVGSAGLLGAGPARAEFDDGVRALQRHDYATAYREFVPLAQQGHMGARFHLGVMYAEGRGVPADRATAFKWFSCVVQGASSVNLAVAARQWQQRVASGLDLDTQRRAQADAVTSCAVAKQDPAAALGASASRLTLPIRQSLVAALFFLPGDVLLLGMQKMALGLSLNWLERALAALHFEFGDWMLGSVSVCFWCVFLRFVFLLVVLVLTAEVVGRFRPSLSISIWHRGESAGGKGSTNRRYRS